MIKSDTINRYNQVQTTKLYTVTVQFELKLGDKKAGKYIHVTCTEVGLVL